MLISVTVTLMVVFAMVRVFQYLGDNLRRSRSIIEMAGQLRSVTHQLQLDLDGVTVPVRPWADPNAGLGYFLFWEGPASDWDGDGDGNADASTPGADTSLGDTDDVLMFTARASGAPFVGRFGDRTIESQVAEIVWRTAVYDRNDNGVADPGEPRLLIRRALLVLPEMQSQLDRTVDPATFFDRYDVSARPNPNPGPSGPTMILNSLADLTVPAGRFVNNGAASSTLFKAFSPLITDAMLRGDPALKGGFGELFVVLGDALAFDVRAFDPRALITRRSPYVAVPGDPGYTTAGGAGAGAYVDLNYANDPSISDFSGPPRTRPTGPGVVVPQAPVPAYDTWSLHFERDGIDQDGDGVEDEGLNGLDDDNTNGVDDPGERETTPPYPVPLRGVEVRIRVIEFSTKQVRQASVVSDFIPE
jgi:hypothetical protein